MCHATTLVIKYFAYNGLVRLFFFSSLFLIFENEDNAVVTIRDYYQTIVVSNSER